MGELKITGVLYGIIRCFSVLLVKWTQTETDKNTAMSRNFFYGCTCTGTPQQTHTSVQNSTKVR